MQRLPQVFLALRAILIVVFVERRLKQHSAHFECSGFVVKYNCD